MVLRVPFNPTLDGGLVDIGDGSASKRSIRIEAGEYDTPFWLRTESGLVVRVDSLPWQGVVDDAELEVLSEAPTPPSGDYPNEPEGFAAVSERGFDALTEDGWQSLRPALAEFYTIVEDGAAPKSPSNVGRVEIPTTYSGGDDPPYISRTGWSARSVYIAFWFKLSANWQGHGSSGVNKVLFLTASGMGAGNPLYFSAQGSGTTQRWEVRMQGGAGGTRNFAWNSADNELDDVSVVLTRGDWHFIETLILGNDNGVAEAEIHSWTNGVKTLQFTGQEILGAGDFNNLRWEAIWGGLGSSPPEDQFQSVDHIYFSVPE